MITNQNATRELREMTEEKLEYHFLVTVKYHLLTGQGIEDREFKRHIVLPNCDACQAIELAFLSLKAIEGPHPNISNLRAYCSLNHDAMKARQASEEGETDG